MRSGLRYWYIWLSVGFGLVALVIYLSVAGFYMPQSPFKIGDKLNHLLAYGVLMGWFGQLFLRWRHRYFIAIALVLLGVSMEFVQGTMAHRTFEWLDAGANSLGVVIAIVALAFGAEKILRKFEVLALSNKQ